MSSRLRTMLHVGPLLGGLLLAACFAACFAGWLAGWGGVARAQSGRRPQGKVEPPVVRIETLEVVVPLLAYDAEGRFVDDLKPEQVLVLEEGESRPVVSLKREPANIVIILDGSNEVGTFKNGPTRRGGGEPERPVWEKRDAGEPGLMVANPTAREFAFQLLRQLSPPDRVAIIQYSDRVQLLQNWTEDPQEAIRALQSKYRVGLRSTWFDALGMATRKLEEMPAGRRLVVVLSDGLDSASRTGRGKVVRELETARATLFVVGWTVALKREIELAVGWMRTHERFTSSSATRLGELGQYLARLEGASIELEQLAESSGGVVWFPPTHGEVVATARRLAEEIGAQYSLSFVTERRPSLEDRRRLEVLPARPGLTVRSRRSHIVQDSRQDSRPAEVRPGRSGQ